MKYRDEDYYRKDGLLKPQTTMSSDVVLCTTMTKYKTLRGWDGTEVTVYEDGPRDEMTFTAPICSFRCPVTRMGYLFNLKEEETYLRACDLRTEWEKVAIREWACERSEKNYQYMYGRSEGRWDDYRGVWVGVDRAFGYGEDHPNCRCVTTPVDWDEELQQQQRRQGMNLTTAIFIINPNVRAIRVSYEPGREGDQYVFKSFDQSIKVDDMVVIPTDSRYKQTVGKVVEVDLDIDIDSSIQFKWIIDKVDLAAHQNVLDLEADAVKKIKSAEMLSKRKELSEKLKADNPGLLDNLAIADASFGAPATPALPDAKTAS